LKAWWKNVKKCKRISIIRIKIAIYNSLESISLHATGKLSTLPFGVTFDAPCHPHHGGQARATKRAAIECWRHIFSSISVLFSLFDKHVGYYKKTKKSSYLFIESN